MKNKGVATKNYIKLNWKKGEPVDPANLGSPTTQTGYSLCVFDHAEGIPRLVSSYAVGANATLWALEPGLAKYFDNVGIADGVTRIDIKADLKPGRSRMRLIATGANLTPPCPCSATEFFELDSSLTVQLLDDEGACWSADFSTSDVKKNMAEVFRAVGP